MKNYHYYLKQELYSHDTQKPRFRGFKWHPEDPLSLYIICQGTSSKKRLFFSPTKQLFADSIQHRTFTWDTFAARLPMPHDTASVAVTDGTRLLITPFRTQNTPPPMSSYHLTLPSTPVHACLSSWQDTAAAVFTNGQVMVWKLDTRLPEPRPEAGPGSGSKLKRGGKVAEPVVVLEKKVEGKRVIRNLALGPRGKVAVLSLALAVDTTDQGGRVNVFGGEGEQGEDEEVEVESDVERILWTDQGNILVLNGQKRLYSRKSCSFSLIKQYHLLTSTKNTRSVKQRAYRYHASLSTHLHPPRRPPFIHPFANIQTPHDRPHRPLCIRLPRPTASHLAHAYVFFPHLHHHLSLCTLCAARNIGKTRQR